ncbi:15184_t:CDS:2 [Acaulospora colombiana]|uniref:15184_t:CDS:1 n=1 Tax=Acaulospora colombiana TaxID=27376 RepID=A0ACA9L1F7_9GLOM|nr:15184_t:CDS:2 [Acaulospora colombiana]
MESEEYLVQSDSDSDGKTLEKVKDYLENSHSNVSAGPSFSAVKVPGFEGDYLSDSSVEETIHIPPLEPTYIGKGKQRADPVDEALYDRGHATSKGQGENPPRQQESMEVDIPLNQDNGLTLDDKAIMSRCLSIFSSISPNYPNWGADEIMVPCPLSGTQQESIANVLTDVNLSYHMGKAPANEKSREKSPFRVAIDDYLQIINNTILERKESSSKFYSNNQSHKIAIGNGKIKMLETLLPILRKFPIKIGIASSMMDTIILVMDRCNQRYGIINDRSNKYHNNLYDEQEHTNKKESFCILFSTDFINFCPNVMPKLDLIVAHDTSFDPSMSLHFSMQNLQTPILRLVTVDSMEQIIAYGLINKVSYLDNFSFEKLSKIFFFGVNRKNFEMTVGVYWRDYKFTEICEKIANHVKIGKLNDLSFGMEDSAERWIEKSGYRGKDWSSSSVPSVYRNFDIESYELSKDISDLSIDHPTPKVNGSTSKVSKKEKNSKRQAESQLTSDPKKMRLDKVTEKNPESIDTNVSEGLTTLKKELTEVLRSQLNAANQKLSSARAEIINLQQKLERANSDELSRLREQVVTLQDRCERELADRKKEILSKQKEIDRLKTECEKLKEDKKNLEEQTTSLNVLNGKVALDAKKSKDEADTKLKIYEVERNRMEQLNIQQSQTITILNGRVDELNNQLFQLNSQLSVQGEHMKMINDEKARLAQLTIQQTQEIGRLKSLNNENNRLSRLPRNLG